MILEVPSSSDSVIRTWRISSVIFLRLFTTHFFCLFVWTQDGFSFGCLFFSFYNTHFSCCHIPEIPHRNQTLLMCHNHRASWTSLPPGPQEGSGPVSLPPGISSHSQRWPWAAAPVFQVLGAYQAGPIWFRHLIFFSLRAHDQHYHVSLYGPLASFHSTWTYSYTSPFEVAARAFSSENHIPVWITKPSRGSNPDWLTLLRYMLYKLMVSDYYWKEWSTF